MLRMVTFRFAVRTPSSECVSIVTVIVYGPGLMFRTCTRCAAALPQVEPAVVVRASLPLAS